MLTNLKYKISVFIIIIIHVHFCLELEYFKPKKETHSRQPIYSVMDNITNAVINISLGCENY